MAYFTRFPSDDFAPLFRLLDDYDSHRATRPKNTQHVTPVRTFAPKFDVRESQEGYYLDGELPGVNQKDVEIEFSDAETLVIKGRSERESTKTNVDENQKQIEGHKSHQPTVEDEEESAETTNAVTKSDKQVAKQTEQPQHKYWISERSIGEFQRTFTFPTRVDQDNVKASLKNGILSIFVPKAAAPTLKKIRVE
ncbi:hypothetical protein DTO212C5_4293 [Paecilomyces variotii]|nr:hypothetical protein DTO212C5_4293 [Paecilomyces variotii]